MKICTWSIRSLRNFKSWQNLSQRVINIRFFKDRKINIITARAGNVIGGGDYSKNRIVPDYLRALNNKKSLLIRNPNI